MEFICLFFFPSNFLHFLFFERAAKIYHCPRLPQPPFEANAQTSTICYVPWILMTWLSKWVNRDYFGLRRRSCQNGTFHEKKKQNKTKIKKKKKCRKCHPSIGLCDIHYIYVWWKTCKCGIAYIIEQTVA